MAGRFNRAIWDGEQKLFEKVKPPTPGDVPLYATVWEQAPETAEHERRGGIVVNRGVDPETGEAFVDILRGRVNAGRFQVFSTRVAVHELDASNVEAPNRSKMQRAARQICRSLGEKQGGYFGEWEFRLLCMAAALVQDSETLAGSAGEAA